MPTFEGRFFNVVLIGNHNPQILSHDFLEQHDILPVDDEPFRELLAQAEADHGQAFTEFISTPVLVSLKYRHISIVVQENRYQITDERFGSPAASPIIKMTKTYFGERLRYTPLTIGGMNLNGLIAFTDAADEAEFDARLGIDRRRASALVEADDLRVSGGFSIPWRNGMIECGVSKPRDRAEPGRINFNYEFRHEEGIETLLANLDDAAQFYDAFRSLLRSLAVEGLE